MLFLKRNKETLIPIGIFLLGLVYYLSYFKYGFAPWDESRIANGALEVLQGRLPLVDFYSSYAPGRYYLLALLFRLFGPSLVVERLMWVPFLALVPVVTYRCARRLMPAFFALLPTLMVLLVPGPWYKILFTLFGLLNLWLIYRYFEESSGGRLLACGLMVGLTAAFRHDVAGFAALTFLLSLLLRRTRFFSHQPRAPTLREAVVGASTYLVGAALAFLPFAVPYISGQAVHDLVYGLLRPAKASYSRSKAFRLPNPFLLLDYATPWEKRASVFLFYMPLVVAFLTLILLVIRSRSRDAEGAQKNLFLFSALLLVLFNYNQVLIGTSAYRILQGGAITYLLMGYLLFLGHVRLVRKLSIATRSPRWRWLLDGGVLLLFLLFPVAFVYHHLQASRQWRVGTIAAGTQDLSPIKGQRGGVYTAKPRVEVISPLVEYVEETTLPQERIWTLVPDSEVLYFLAGRERPPSLAKQPLRPRSWRIMTVLDDDPDMIILKLQDLLHWANWKKLRDVHEDIYEYIAYNYHYEHEIGSYLVMRRGPDAATAHLVLGDYYLASGRAQEAAQEYERALSLKSRFRTKAWFHLRLGRAYLESGRRDEAIREYQKALELEPHNVRAQRALDALGE